MIFKKAINIVLIISVVAIWSFVGFRFFKNTEDVPTPDFQINSLKSPDIFIGNKGNNTLVVSSKNPFNRNQLKPKVNRNIIPVAPKRVIEKERVTTATPNVISYHGNLSDDSGNKIFILKINRQIKRFKKGQKIGDVTLLKVIDNGVLVLDKKKQKEIFEID